MSSVPPSRVSVLMPGPPSVTSPLVVITPPSRFNVLVAPSAAISTPNTLVHAQVEPDPFSVADPEEPLPYPNCTLMQETLAPLSTSRSPAALRNPNPSVPWTVQFEPGPSIVALPVPELIPITA